MKNASGERGLSINERSMAAVGIDDKNDGRKISTG
jgi:hypothetical protein